MSEYQYYEFRTVDRSLSTQQMAELATLSSRAEITATSFTNTYSYGNFRGDPERMMEQYFDVFVYVANWGTRRFMVRLPLQGVDVATIEAYSCDEMSFWIKDGFAILSFQAEDDCGGDWEEGEEWMPGLISLREELLNGDFRSLYLGWLSGIYPDDNETEPPVPAGLRTLTAAQSVLASFLRIDGDLIEVAAERSADRTDVPFSQTQLAEWLQSHPMTTRDAWLLDLLGESSQAIRFKVLLQFRQSQLSSSSQSVDDTPLLRTCRELREAADERAKEAERRREEVAAGARKKAAENAAKLRNLELDRLAQRIDAAWGEVDRKISTKQTNQYVLAVKELSDLRDLATRDRQTDQFDARLLDLVHRHAKKPAFLERLRKAGLNR